MKVPSKNGRIGWESLGGNVASSIPESLIYHGDGDASESGRKPWLGKS